MAQLEIVGIRKTFPGTAAPGGRLLVLDDINLSVERRQIVSITGPSGCGKTTLLRIVAGLIQPDSGSCLLNGEAITEPRADIAFVFQHFNLLPWRSTLGNVELGLEFQGVPKADRRRRARHYLELVGLNDFEEHRTYQLSGGMQQRVGLARALAIEPEIMLMDEPFASLDHQTAERLRDELLHAQAETQRTILIITHNIDEALYLSDRVVVLAPNPGRVARIIDLDFPTPRWEHDLYGLPEFGRLRIELRHMLIDGHEGQFEAVAQ